MSAKMKETLQRFGEQFSWEFEVENKEALEPIDKFLVAAMGGSHLGAWLIKAYGPGRDLAIHRGYGLGRVYGDFLKDRLFIGSSFSGTTEETLDALEAAGEAGMPRAAVSKGGDLIARAQKYGIPYVQFPDAGLEPRMAIGYNMLALARLMGDDALEEGIRGAGARINPLEGEVVGIALGEKLRGKIPMVWSSHENLPLAFIWKIKFNETSKIPAFCNSMPEICHNELTGMDVIDSTRAIVDQVHVIMLEDESDHPRVQKRMQVAREMLGERGIAVERIQLDGIGFEKAFKSALLADWVSLSLADFYGVPNPETPLIAEFKKRITQ